MADDHNRYTVARGDFMGLHGAMDRVQATGEDAIVQDLNQSYWGDGAQHADAKGDYFDVWADGQLIDSTDSEADAAQSLREYRRQHPKR
jgi:hypothetical protein